MMDQRAIVGLVLMFLFYMGYTQYLQRKYPNYNQSSQTSEPTVAESTKDAKSDLASPSVSKDTEQTPGAKVEKQISVEKKSQLRLLSTEELTLENDLVVIKVDQDLGAFSKVSLKKYFAKADGTKIDFDLIERPMFLRADTSPKVPTTLEPIEMERRGNTLIFRRKTDSWAITQSMRLSDKLYQLEVDTSFTNISDKSQDLSTALQLQEGLSFPKAQSIWIPGVPHEAFALVAGVEGSLQKKDAKSYCEDEDSDKEVGLESKPIQLQFAGIDKHYFLKAILPSQAGFAYRIEKIKGPTLGDASCGIQVSVFQDQGDIKAKQTVEQKFQVYLGPKDKSDLVAVKPELYETVDYGWFSVIAKPLLYILRAVYNVVGNYGIAIILVTALLKIVLYPLTRASAVSMKKMQKFQPELNKIKEKFKDDRAAQQREMMAFMAKHKINPAKGCLPVLPQIPVFIAFFNVLSHSIELRHAPFYGWINDLSASDPYYVSPLLLGVGMLIQQKLTPNPSMDKTQERIMMLMPLLFTFMMVSLPAGLVLYMLTNTFISIAMQQWLNHSLKNL